MSERRYDDREVAEILKGATEMQSGLAQSGTEKGLTLDELLRVAQDVGIDPANIERAARDLETIPKGKSRNRSDSFLLERSVIGQISEEGWDEIITELRRAVGKPGNTENSDNSHEWTGRNESISMMLNLSNRKGRTRLRLLGNSTGYTGTATVGGMTIGLFATLIPMIVSFKTQFNHPEITVFLMLFVAFMCWAATAGLIIKNRRKVYIETEMLLNKLVEVAKENLVSQDSFSTPIFETKKETPIEHRRLTS